MMFSLVSPCAIVAMRRNTCGPAARVITVDPLVGDAPGVVEVLPPAVCCADASWWA